MISLKRTRKVTSQDAHDARARLLRAQKLEQQALEKAVEVRPVIKKLEEHLKDNNFGQLVWNMYRGTS